MDRLRNDSMPDTLAVIDARASDTGALSAFLRPLGCEATAFADGDDFLVSENPYAFRFFVVDLDVPGVGGLDLVRLLRRRSTAGVVALASASFEDRFAPALDAGADMLLAKPIPPDRLAAAVRAVHRRASTLATDRPWRLDAGRGELLSPNGVPVALSPIDVSVLGCFVKARDVAVAASTLCARLGRPQARDAENWLHATIYRLRRRIERATPEMVPLQSVPRVGYVFRADLQGLVNDEAAGDPDGSAVVAFRRRRASFGAG